MVLGLSRDDISIILRSNVGGSPNPIVSSASGVY